MGEQDKTDPTALTPLVSEQDAAADLRGLIDRVRAEDGDRILLARDGKPVAALISAEDLAFFEELEDENDLRFIAAAKAEPGFPGKTKSLEEVMRDLGIKQ